MVSVMYLPPPCAIIHVCASSATIYRRVLPSIEGRPALVLLVLFAMFLLLSNHSQFCVQGFCNLVEHIDIDGILPSFNTTDIFRSDLTVMSRAEWIELVWGDVYSSSSLWYSSSSSGVRMPMERMWWSSKNLRSLLVSSTCLTSCGSLYFSLKRRAYSAIRASSPFVRRSLLAEMISLASIVLTTVLPFLRWKYTLHKS